MIFFILACGEEVSKDTSTPEPSSEEGTTGTYNPTAQVEWGEEQLVVYMSNTEGYDFYFGIVESTEECTQNIEYGCWTGEDCSPTEPYISSDESILLGPYCHPADGEGVAIALNYSSGFDSIFQGESQLMVIKLDPKTYGEQSLRMRLPNSSSTQDKLPGIGDRITLGLKVADSYFVERSHGGS